MSKIFFRHPEHLRRFLAALQQHHKIEPDGKIDREYGAAFYILSSDLGTWEKAQEYIGHGIGFEELISEIHFSHGSLLLVKLAANLFGTTTELPDGTFIPLTVTPVELIDTLDETNFRIAMSAIDLRRNGANISDFLGPFEH